MEQLSPLPQGYRLSKPIGPDPGEGVHRRAIMALGSLLVVLVGAAIAVPLAARAGPSPAAVVHRALEASLTRRTADMSVTASIRAKGEILTETAAGQVDFRDEDESLDITMTTGRTGLEVQDILVANTLYVQAPGIPGVEPGKAWISVSPATLTLLEESSPTNGLTSDGNPLATVRSIEDAGATVRPLGASGQRNRSLRVYQLTLGRSQLASWVSKKLPPSLRTLRSSKRVRTLSVTVRVSQAGTVASMTTRLAMVQGGTNVSVDQRASFSTYGTQVTIVAPPSNRVVGLRPFVHAAQALGAPVVV